MSRFLLTAGTMIAALLVVGSSADAQRRGGRHYSGHVEGWHSSGRYHPSGAHHFSHYNGRPLYVHPHGYYHHASLTPWTHTNIYNRGYNPYGRYGHWASNQWQRCYWRYYNNNWCYGYVNNGYFYSAPVPATYYMVLINTANGWSCESVFCDYPDAVADAQTWQSEGYQTDIRTKVGAAPG